MRKTNLVKIALYILSISLSSLFFLCSCNSNAEIEALVKENKRLKQEIEQLTKETDKEDIATDNSKFIVKFQDVGTSITFGNAEHIAKITNAGIVYSPNLDKHLLIIDFHYTNKNANSANFINDIYCNVAAYQDGIQLDTPGFTSEKNIYDTNNSYKNIKNAEIDTQLAFELSNTTSDIELELGYYNSTISKKISISKK